MIFKMSVPIVKKYVLYIAVMLTSLATYVGVRIIFYPRVYVLEAYDFSTGRWLLKKGNYMDSVQFVITDPNILNELKSQWVLSKDRFREIDGATTGGYIVELHNDGKRVFSMDICYGEGPGELVLCRLKKLIGKSLSSM